MSQKIMYKVVRKQDGKRFSINIDIPTRFRLEYRRGRLIKPVVGKIFVFGTEKEAFSFRNERNNMEVWKVLANNPVKGEKRVWRASKDELVSFWRGIEQVLDTGVFSVIAPVGTHYCDSLWMLEKIKK
jgi:hypothetical protein